MPISKQEPVCLNLGSGQRPFAPPFLNYDIQEKKWREYTINKGCKWAGNPWSKGHDIYDIIVLHHVLEHFGCGEADDLIMMCKEALKPMGSLLVFVPNMEALFRGWKLGRINTQVYMTNVYGAYMGDEADRHRWGYDYISLTEYLWKFGFSSMAAFDWRKIKGADIAGPDWWILGVEALK